MRWFFGYGSLIWRPGFEYEARQPARLANHARRFWQGSPDHRGSPQQPGRVVTLTHLAGHECQGVVFGVSETAFESVLQYLDIRESGGYERTIQTVALNDGRQMDAIVYVGRPENPSYLGPADPVAMARQISESHGPSGPNLEYLLRLRTALLELGCLDEHIEEIVAHLPQGTDP